MTTTQYFAAFRRASHIQPWRDSSNEERLDPNNGILLTPTYDHLFDKHLITFTDDGKIIFSWKIPADVIEGLGLNRAACGGAIGKKTRQYLARHRTEFNRLDQS